MTTKKTETKKESRKEEPVTVQKEKKAPFFSGKPYKVESVAPTPEEHIDWGLYASGIHKVWQETMGEGIKVAVLDTGIDAEHPDLARAVLTKKDFTGSPFGVHDYDGHGTHVAGIIAARKNGMGVVGVAPKAMLVVGKVLGDNGIGSVEQVAEGIQWAIEKEVSIINMSLGCPSDSPIIKEAIDAATEKGILVVCAAGNRGAEMSALDYPAQYPETIAVGAIDRQLKRAYFSSTGRMVDIVAPGDYIRSTYIRGFTAVLSGTSMAAPFVSGVIALMLAKHRDYLSGTPADSHIRVIEHLRKTAIDCDANGFDLNCGFGMLNPVKFVGRPNESKTVIDLPKHLSSEGAELFRKAFGGNILPNSRGETFVDGSLRTCVGEKEEFFQFNY